METRPAKGLNLAPNQERPALTSLSESPESNRLLRSLVADRFGSTAILQRGSPLTRVGRTKEP